MKGETTQQTVRKNFRLPIDLVEWSEKHASDTNRSLTQLIKDLLTRLRNKEERRDRP